MDVAPTTNDEEATYKVELVLPEGSTIGHIRKDQTILDLCEEMGLRPPSECR